MKSRSILFSAPMVRAILDGRKSQTRRIIKPQPPADGIVPNSCGSHISTFRCPHGQVGDLLWVRESWRPIHDRLSECTGPEDIRFAASVSEAEWATSKWRPSIHMPRWASRITLRVTGVRVERLCDISPDDAAAEGWPGPDESNSIHSAYPIAWYARLWEEINGRGSWDTKTWVWIISFERVAESTRAAA